ncbi:MAG TPA: response regulator [Vicinamibacterales bacterium]|jgi:two-component system response regulator (stage 0 sporulation protein F)
MVNDDDTINAGVERFLNLKRSKVFKGQAMDSPGRRVLVVDDEWLIRWSLAEALNDAGYAVTQASDGQSAVQVLQEETVDVVLLDYRLPDSSDLQLLSRLRSLAPDARVIMMTAYGSPEMTREALALGALRVVHKPFDMQKARALVDQASRQGSDQP